MWHRRLGHLNIPDLKSLRNLATGIAFKNDADVGTCIPCIMGKQHRLPFKGPGKRAKKLLELVHTDLCGPTDISTNNSRYFFTLIDDFSRKTFVYFLENKSEVLNVFKEWKTYVENQTGEKLKCLRSDNGTEYVNQGLRKLESSMKLQFPIRRNKMV